LDINIGALVNVFLYLLVGFSIPQKMIFLDAVFNVNEFLSFFFQLRVSSSFNYSTITVGPLFVTSDPRKIRIKILDFNLIKVKYSNVNNTANDYFA
jgi:hypothetical protein